VGRRPFQLDVSEEELLRGGKGEADMAVFKEALAKRRNPAAAK
jgi:hypothetical protein